MLSDGSRLHDRYTVVRLIGQGGMGAVYLCRDDRLAEATWALKELHHEPQEGQVLSKLQHPQLPIVVDFFSENGRFYLVREYVPGINLAEKVEQDGPLGESITLAWALQMAEVLDFLHSQKPPILYRDLKPQNIVLSPAGLKLIDFGLAGAAQEVSGASESGHPRPAGSLSYSAPEQLDDPAAACEASDLYGLGAVLYFLLLGHPPSPIAGRHRLLTHRPDLLPETEELILRCLEQEPRRRFTSASELMVTIQYLQSRYPRLLSPRQEPVVEHLPDPATLRASLKVRSGWLGKALSGLLLLFALVASGWLILRSLPGSPGHVAPQIWTARVPKGWSRVSLGPNGYPQPTQAECEDWFKDLPESALAQVLRQNLHARSSASHLPVLAPFSGDYAEFGEWMTRGVAIFLDELGERAPIIELYDTGARSEDALKVTQTLVKRKELKGMLGPFTSQLALMVAPVCNMEHFSLISPAATDPRMLTGGPYLFSLAPPQKERFQALLDALVRRGAHNILILQPDAASIYYSVADVFEERLLQKKPQERASVRRVVYPSDLRVGPNYTGQVFSQSFDCVFVADNRPGPVAHVVTFLRKNGFKGPVACLVHPGSRELLSEGEGKMDGVLLVSFMGLDNLPHLQAFLERHRRLFKEEASTVSAISYCAVHQLWQACEDNSDREGVQRALAKGCMPDVAFGQATSYGQVYIIEGGAYVPDKDGSYSATPSPGQGESGAPKS